MTRKDYKERKVIDVVCALGAIVGLIESVFKIPWGIIGIIFAIVIIVIVFKPDDPLPYHWLVFLLFGIALVIGGGILGGIIVIIGAIVALIDVL